MKFRGFIALFFSQRSRSVQVKASNEMLEKADVLLSFSSGMMFLPCFIHFMSFLRLLPRRKVFIYYFKLDIMSRVACYDIDGKLLMLRIERN